VYKTRGFPNRGERYGAKPWFFYEWNTCNEKPRCAPNFSPEFLGGKYKSLKKQQQTDYFVKMAQQPSEYGNIEII
jgi:hypothetical protein